MLSIPKYPEQYAQHFPAMFCLLCCAFQHHVWPRPPITEDMKTLVTPALNLLLISCLSEKQIFIAMF